jgi:hypothetical protein
LNQQIARWIGVRWFCIELDPPSISTANRVIHASPWRHGFSTLHPAELELDTPDADIGDLSQFLEKPLCDLRVTLLWQFLSNVLVGLVSSVNLNVVDLVSSVNLDVVDLVASLLIKDGPSTYILKHGVLARLILYG